MSKQTGTVTAEELMNQLASNPEFIAMRAAKEQKRAELLQRINVTISPLLQKLADAGYAVDSISSLTSQYAPLSADIVIIVVGFLEGCNDDRIQEALVRCLAASKQPFDGTVLMKTYKATSSESLKFAILNTIALTRPININNWISELRRNDYVDKKLTDLGWGGVALLDS